MSYRITYSAFQFKSIVSNCEICIQRPTVRDYNTRDTHCIEHDESIVAGRATWIVSRRGTTRRWTARRVSSRRRVFWSRAHLRCGWESLWGQRRKEDSRWNVVKAGMKVGLCHYRERDRGRDSIDADRSVDRSVGRLVSRWSCFR